MKRKRSDQQTITFPIVETTSPTSGVTTVDSCDQIHFFDVDRKGVESPVLKNSHGSLHVDLEPNREAAFSSLFETSGKSGRRNPFCSARKYWMEFDPRRLYAKATSPCLISISFAPVMMRRTRPTDDPKTVGDIPAHVPSMRCRPWYLDRREDKFVDPSKISLRQNLVASICHTNLEETKSNQSR